MPEPMVSYRVVLHRGTLGTAAAALGLTGGAGAAILAAGTAAGVRATRSYDFNQHSMGELTRRLRRGDNVLAVIVDGRWLDVPPEAESGGPTTMGYLQPASTTSAARSPRRRLRRPMASKLVNGDFTGAP